MPRDHAPGVRQLPSTGLTQTQLTLAYESNRLAFLRRCVDEHGPLVQIGPQTYLVADPAFAMHVLRHTHDQFEVTRVLGREPSQGSKSPGHGAWITWRDVILGAQKNEQHLDEHMQWVTTHTENFCDRWTQVGRIEDLRMELELLTATSFARYAYGDGAYDDVVAKTQSFLRALLVIVGSPFEIPFVLGFLPRRRRFVSTLRSLEAAIGDAMPVASANSIVGAVRDSGYDPHLLQRYMATMHAAGTVPTAVLMWALLELGRHPDIADEIAETGDSEWFVKEVMRLWPATWLIMRETLEDVTCENVSFPAGSVVLLSPYLIHRYAPCFADDPDAFRPERWRGLRPPSGSYIPFGAGPSWCLGGRFAERELNTMVPVLARRLRVHVDTTDVKVDSRRSLQPELSSLGVSARSG